MMSRYIDADAISRKYVIAELSDLADEFSELDENELHSERWCGITDAKQVVVNAPSIDIEPKRGEWKPFDLTWGRSIWYCTACEESTEVPCDIWEHKPIYKYCPNCGADMREVRNE